jgi:hypothetical protein
MDITDATMIMPDLEKGFTYSAPSVADEPRFSRNPTNPRDDMECWNAEFFKRLQSLSDAELTGFSKRTRVLEFRQLSRIYIAYLEWMLLQEMRVFKDNLDDPVRAQAKVERIGEMLRNYCKMINIILRNQILNDIASHHCTRLGICASTRLSIY